MDKQPSDQESDQAAPDERKFMNEPLHPKKRRKWLWFTVAFLVLAGAGAAAYMYLKPAQKAAVVQKPTASPAPAGSTGSIPSSLFHANQARQGMAIGYIKVPKASATPKPQSFVGSAYADSVDYQPAVFYKGADSKIYTLNTVTKQSSAVTTTAGSMPVFASATQKLAYKRDCSLVVKNFSDSSETVAQQGAQSATCYTPTNWSPNGKLLAYSGCTSVQNELGLIGYCKLSLYNAETKVVTALDPPTGFDSLQSYYDAVWRDDSTLVIHYVKWGTSASIVKEEVVQMDVNSKKVTVMDSLAQSLIQSMQFVGDTVYVRNDKAGTLQKTSVSSDDPLATINGSDGAGPYLLKTNDAGTQATDIYSFDGHAGERNGVKLNQLPAAGGQKTVLFTPTGFSSSVLGWGKNFDEVIYLEFQSPTNAVEIYNLSTDKSEILVPNLPLQV